MIRESKAYQIQQRYNAQKTPIAVNLFDVEYPSEFLLYASKENLKMILDDYFEGVDSHARVAVVTNAVYNDENGTGCLFFFIKAASSNDIWAFTTAKNNTMSAMEALKYTTVHNIPIIFDATKHDPMIAAFHNYREVLLDIPNKGIVNIAEMYLYFKRFIKEATATHKEVFKEDDHE